LKCFLNIRTPTHCKTIKTKIKLKWSHSFSVVLSLWFSLWRRFWSCYTSKFSSLVSVFVWFWNSQHLSSSTWLRIRKHFTLPSDPVPTRSPVLIAGPRLRPVWCDPGCVVAPKDTTVGRAGSTWAYTAVHNCRPSLKM